MGLGHRKTISIEVQWAGDYPVEIAYSDRPAKSISKADLPAYLDSLERNGWKHVRSSPNKDSSLDFYTLEVPAPAPTVAPLFSLALAAEQEAAAAGPPWPGGMVKLSGPWLAAAQCTRNEVHVYAERQGLWNYRGRFEVSPFQTAVAQNSLICGLPKKQEGRGEAWIYDLTAGTATPPVVLRQPVSDWDEAAVVDGAAFGSSVAAHADTLAIAAEGAARLYLYERRGHDWELRSVIRSSTVLTLDSEWLTVLSDDGQLLIYIKRDSIWQLAQSIAREPATDVAMRGGRMVRAIWPRLEYFALEEGEWRWKQTLEVPASGEGSMSLNCAIEGDIAIAGEHGRFSRTGAVHVFQRRGDTWELAQTITLPDGAPGDNFGQYLALAGGRLVIGAPWRSGGGGFYVYRRTSL